MKIGIITFHQADNYGAVLQAYALQEAIREQGKDAFVLDYNNKIIGSKDYSFQNFIKNPLTYLVGVFNSFFQVKVRNIKFNIFRKRYLRIRPFPVDMKVSDYDCIVLGSDQIWNPTLTGGIDPVYWGSREIFKGKRVVTYAASSGKIELFANYSNSVMREYLSNISSITVRENRLKDYLLDRFCIQSDTVVDPTLLHDVEFYERLASNKLLNYPYVLYYNVEGNPYALGLAKMVAKQKKAKLICLGNSSIIQSIKNPTVKYINATIPEMLSLIKNAEAVVALSFHGTIFSILFHKEFYSVRGGNMARVEDILKRTHLMDRIIDSECFKISTIDSFEFSDEALREIRYFSSVKLSELISDCQ